MLHVLLQVGLCGGFGNDVEVGDIFGVESATEYDFDLAKINGVSVGTLDGFDTPYLCVSLKCVSDVAGKGGNGLPILFPHCRG